MNDKERNQKAIESYIEGMKAVEEEKKADHMHRELNRLIDLGYDEPNGVFLIAAERIRQRIDEHYSDAHDDEHGNYEMVRAACCYAEVGNGGPYSHPNSQEPPDDWPWEDAYWKPSADPVHNLTKAGALIAAEIDRLLRMRMDIYT
ncbi:MAG: hypothetical protein BAJALOKI3v1_50064 [Promethearchaeota archaeon]|nr:MAG: hypothetical protein BAJALOKI3v1_50064 [Candidatus Lokiarchaeota archaeon]